MSRFSLKKTAEMWWEGGQRQTCAVFGLKDKVHIPKLSPPQRAAQTNFRIIPHSLSSVCHRPRQGCHCNGSRDAEEFRGSVSQALNHRQCPGEGNRKEGKVNLFGSTWSMPCSREQLFLWDFLKFSPLHLRSHPVPLAVPGNTKWKMETEENYFLNWEQIILSPFPTKLREQKEACKRFCSY